MEKWTILDFEKTFNHLLFYTKLNSLSGIINQIKT